jgi:sodium transport system permease protein
MRLRAVYRIVFRKEARELLRDRRSLFWLFAPPVILPGLALCAGLFIGTQVVRIAREGFPVMIENGDQAPELVRRFEAEDSIHLVDPPENPGEDPYGDAIVIVSLPPDFQQRLDNGDTARLELITRDNSLLTFFARSAVRSVIDSYNTDVLDDRLREKHLTRDWLTPISVGEGRRSTVEAVAGVGEDGSGNNVLATIFLPLAVTSWLLGGGMGLILDTTVGEKERQTIENLLVTPASRIGIVMGKMTVVFIASMAVMGLWLTEGLALSAFGNAGPELADAGTLTLSEALRILAENSGNLLSLIGALLVLIIPFTIMLNGLVMAFCAYAANYREANLFMALVQLGLPASVLLTIFSLPPSVAEPVYAIPFFGAIVAIRDLFSNTLSFSGLAINFAAGLVYAGAGIGLAAWVFGREWSLTRGLH